MWRLVHSGFILFGRLLVEDLPCCSCVLWGETWVHDKELQFILSYLSEILGSWGSEHLVAQRALIGPPFVFMFPGTI